MTTRADQLSQPRLDAALLEWQVHLARRQPARALTAVAMTLGAAVCAWIIMASAFSGLLVGALLLAAIGEHLFPIRYRITREGVWARGAWSARRMRWHEVRRCYGDARGIKLSPLTRPSRLEAYRGIYLWFEGNEEAVLDVIRRCRDGEETTEGHG